MRLTVLCLLAVVAACAAGATAESLARAVGMYNDAVRWQRFEQAALWVPPPARAAFLARFQAAQDRLHVVSAEVRGVTPIAGLDLPTYDVVVTISAYLLPNNVLTELVTTQRWQFVADGWTLVASEPELVPPLR